MILTGGEGGPVLQGREIGVLKGTEEGNRRCVQVQVKAPEQLQ